MRLATLFAAVCDDQAMPCFLFCVFFTVLLRSRSQSNRPLDNKVQEAQSLLAKALRRGGKRVLLPGLELRCCEG